MRHSADYPAQYLEQTQLYKRPKVSLHESAHLQSIEEQLSSHQQLITSFQQDINQKLDEKLSEMKLIENEIKTTMRDNFKEQTDALMKSIQSQQPQAAALTRQRMYSIKSECSDMLS